MNSKWYEIIAAIIDEIPTQAWENQSLERMLVLICDAQVEAASENIAEWELVENLLQNVVGGDEPGMCDGLRE